MQRIHPSLKLRRMDRVKKNGFLYLWKGDQAMGINQVWKLFSFLLLPVLFCRNMCIQ
jgi:hypothetical protein